MRVAGAVHRKIGQQTEEIATQSANEDLISLRQPNLLPFSVSLRCYPGNLGLYDKSIRSCRYTGARLERGFEGWNHDGDNSRERTGASTTGDDERRRGRQNAGVFLRSYGIGTKASYRDVHVKHYCFVPQFLFLGSGKLLSFVSHR